MKHCQNCTTKVIIINYALPVYTPKKNINIKRIVRLVQCYCLSIERCARKRRLREGSLRHH